MSVTADEASGRDGVIDARAAQARAHAIATFLSGLGLFLLLLTLQPFAAAPQTLEGESSGNIVNQIGYVTLALIYGTAMAVFCERAALARLRSSSLIVVLVVAAISLPQALDPEASFRALMLASFALVLVAGVLLLPWTQVSFARAAAHATLALLILVYAALVLAPSLAIHGSDGVEGVHAGHWRGHLTHKNYAAPVFSMVAMFGIYVWRMGLRWRGAAIVLLSVVFVLNSGSKTTMGFLPIAIGLVLMARLTGRPRLMLAVHAGFVLLVGALTVGTVLSPTLLQISAAINADPTFTGRDEIWKFAAAKIAEKPWLGHGYVSFWQTAAVTRLEENFEASWDVRGIGSGHNSYLDALLMFGIPGGLVMTYVLMIKPLRNYLVAQADPERRRLADLGAMMVMFMTYIGMLESFFLNRAEPIWLLLAFSVLALELASRMGLRRG